MANFQNVGTCMGSVRYYRGVLAGLLLGLTTGCTPMMVVSAGSFVATGRTPTEHVLTAATPYDCSVGNVTNGLYYCEHKRDAGNSYPKTGF